MTLFLDAWTAIGAPSPSSASLEMASLPFLRPLSLPLPSQFMIITKPIQIAVVDEEFAALLAKHAIRRVSRMSLALVSWMFVVPKKDGGWRPINLKWLNRTFLDASHFRMDTVRDAAALLCPGDWAASVDLKDAYFHIPIIDAAASFASIGEASSTNTWFFHLAFAWLRSFSQC